MRLIMPMLLGATLFVSGLAPQPPPDAPAARGGHAMTYDSHQGLALMFGGGSRQQSFNDLWAWNGERWQRLADSGRRRATRRRSPTTRSGTGRSSSAAGPSARW